MPTSAEFFVEPKSIHWNKQIYLCGNSLGLQPKRTSEYVKQVMEQWSNLGVEWWFDGDSPWLELDSKVCKMLSQIVGAKTSEVVAMNSLTVNLHLALSKFYRPEWAKKKILIEQDSFPSDYVAVSSQIISKGGNPEIDIIEVKYAPGSHIISEEDIIEAIETNHNELALIVLPGVHYYTWQAFDIARITAVAKKHGITIGRDLAHAVANVSLNLHDDGVDFAVWCNYKYLNAWPGAVGGMFVHEKHLVDSDQLQWRRWEEVNKRFKMDHVFDPAQGALRMQISTTAALPITMLLASLSVFEEVGLDVIQERREELKEKMMQELIRLCEKYPDRMDILTPIESHRRWSQVSLYFHDGDLGKRVFDGLVKQGIIWDRRNPNVIRLAPVPLYNTIDEIEIVAKTLDSLLSQG